jgi:hypothetical protein
MAQQENTLFYQPLISANDRIVKMPIAGWGKALRHSLKNAILERDTMIGEVAPCLNQLALLEAYQSNNANALALCNAQINFWRNLFVKSGDRFYLSSAIQPWINIARLNRWQNKIDNSASIYQELSLENRSELGGLSQFLQVDFSLADLCRFDNKEDAINLIDNVYWNEYGRLLLNSDRYTDLQLHIQVGLGLNTSFFIKSALFEILFLYQLKIGKPDRVLHFLNELNFQKDHPYWLQFKVLEMALHVQFHREDAQSLITEACQAVRSENHVMHDARGAQFIFDISKVFRHLGRLEIEIELLQFALSIAQKADDEVLLFEVMERLSVLEQLSPTELLARFCDSSYAIIRKRLNLGALPNSVCASSPYIVQAANLLAELDFEGCLNVLNSIPAQS